MVSLLAAAAALSPKFVSLHDFALVPLPPCLPFLSLFVISLLAGSLLLCASDPYFPTANYAGLEKICSWCLTFLEMLSWGLCRYNSFFPECVATVFRWGAGR